LSYGPFTYPLYYIYRHLSIETLIFLFDINRYVSMTYDMAGSPPSRKPLRGMDLE